MCINSRATMRRSKSTAPHSPLLIAPLPSGTMKKIKNSSYPPTNVYQIGSFCDVWWLLVKISVIIRVYFDGRRCQYIAPDFELYGLGYSFFHYSWLKIRKQWPVMFMNDWEESLREIEVIARCSLPKNIHSLAFLFHIKLTQFVFLMYYHFLLS